jgi:hypothetical protein
VPNVSWEDIGGLENVKRELQEVLKLIYIPLFANIYFLFQGRPEYISGGGFCLTCRWRVLPSRRPLPWVNPWDCAGL